MGGGLIRFTYRSSYWCLCHSLFKLLSQEDRNVTPPWGGGGGCWGDLAPAPLSRVIYMLIAGFHRQRSRPSDPNIG